jgi:putative FmdB family regulatory protein
MPTYEYRCNACGREFEYQQRMADDDLVKCEACHEDKLEKLISRTAFQLKGGGWYKDLYSSTKPAEPAKDSTAPAATAEKSTDKSTDKPADKPAAKAESGGTSGGSDSGSSSTTTSTPAASAPASTATKPSSTP